MKLRRAFIGIVAASACVAGCSSDRPPKIEAGGPPPITTGTSGVASAEPAPAAAATREAASPTAPVPAEHLPPAARRGAAADAPEIEPPRPSSAPVSPSPSEPPWDPLKRMEEDQAKEASKKLLIADQEEKIRALEMKIDELQKRRLTIFDEFLPPPQLPPEEAKAWEGLNGPQRVERVDGQILSAQAELVKARDELKRLKQGVY